LRWALTGPVIETHSDERGALRIDRPFPALAEWAAGLDLAGMDSTEHSHVPYVVLLVRALQDWKAAVRPRPLSPPARH
jgi:amyloid beta precursor protein binding protein 1